MTSRKFAASGQLTAIEIFVVHVSRSKWQNVNVSRVNPVIDSQPISSLSSTTDIR